MTDSPVVEHRIAAPLHDANHRGADAPRRIQPCDRRFARSVPSSIAGYLEKSEKLRNMRRRLTTSRPRSAAGVSNRFASVSFNADSVRSSRTIQSPPGESAPHSSALLDAAAVQAACAPKRRRFGDAVECCPSLRPCAVEFRLT
jgi:hypothetical protein